MAKNSSVEAATLNIESNGATVIRIPPALSRLWQKLAAEITLAELSADCEPSGCTLSIAICPAMLPEVSININGVELCEEST